MKMDARYKPELCVSSDVTRYQLADPWLDVDQKKLVATDGHLLIAVPVEVEEGEQSQFISHELLQIAREKFRSYQDGTVNIRDGAIPDGPTWPTQQGAPRLFPKWLQVIPPFKKGDPGTFTIGLNVNLLKKLVDAVGLKGEVEITGQYGAEMNPPPFLIKPVRLEDGEPEPVVLLMPIRIKSAEGAFGCAFVVPPAPAATAPTEGAA